MIHAQVILATAGVLLVAGGVLMAAFTAIAPSDAPSVIGPAVVIGSAPPSSRPGTPAAMTRAGHVRYAAVQVRVAGQPQVGIYIVAVATAPASG